MKKITKLFVLAALLMAGSQIYAQEEHEYVDLGLPSGTLWATCNLGATTPEGYGDYFAWGETIPKDTYDWKTYIYCYEDWQSMLTKYCNKPRKGYNGVADNLTILQSGDDAATANWGDEWCTPTKEQWEELDKQTTSKWLTSNGVEGRLYTSKINGASIFLPKAGYRWGRELQMAGYQAYYWSRSLCTDDPSLAMCYFVNPARWWVTGINRGNGCSVRPVRSAK